MAELKHSVSNGALTVYCSGHIHSANAAEVERSITALRERYAPTQVILDCTDLKYISSAGLRIVLRVKKAVNDTQLVNVSPDVYEIFDTTGFTEMMDVRKAYRVLSVEGSEVIGEGANGKVYRIDPDTIVKVYRNPDALPEIQRERELARTAFVLGIPTAIPYDVVRIEGGGYGSVFELLNAASFADLLISGRKTVDEIAKMSIDLLKIIHSTVVKPDAMPDMRAVALGWADFLRDVLPADRFQKLRALIAAVPEDDHMMHGDYHIKNIMLQNGESLLIDMDTLCHGHPIFELASMYNAYVGYGALDPNKVSDFLGIPFDTALALWRKSLALYLGDADEARVRDVENKARIIGCARIMRRTIRRNGLETEDGRQLVGYCRSCLDTLLEQVDTLIF